MLAITINDVCLGATVTTKSDEHNGLLRQLTGTVGNPVLAHHLANTADPQDIIDAVSTNKAATGGSGEKSDFTGSELEVASTNPCGFHLRVKDSDDCARLTISRVPGK